MDFNWFLQVPFVVMKFSNENRFLQKEKMNGRNDICDIEVLYLLMLSVSFRTSVCHFYFLKFEANRFHNGSSEFILFCSFSGTKTTIITEQYITQFYNCKVYSSAIFMVAFSSCRKQKVLTLSIIYALVKS